MISLFDTGFFNGPPYGRYATHKMSNERDYQAYERSVQTCPDQRTYNQQPQADFLCNMKIPRTFFVTDYEYCAVAYEKGSGEQNGRFASIAEQNSCETVYAE
jgi:hypothetical protein